MSGRLIEGGDGGGGGCGGGTGYWMREEGLKIALDVLFVCSWWKVK